MQTLLLWSHLKLLSAHIGQYECALYCLKLWRDSTIEAAVRSVNSARIYI